MSFAEESPLFKILNVTNYRHTSSVPLQLAQPLFYSTANTVLHLDLVQIAYEYSQAANLKTILYLNQTPPTHTNLKSQGTEMSVKLSLPVSYSLRLRFIKWV